MIEAVEVIDPNLLFKILIIKQKMHLRTVLARCGSHLPDALADRNFGKCLWGGRPAGPAAKSGKWDLCDRRHEGWQVGIVF